MCCPEDSSLAPVQLTDEQWKARLSPLAYRVLREHATERPFTGSEEPPGPGIYVCAGCDAELFRAATQFNSGCGWPAFYAAVEGSTVYIDDHSLGMTRTEVRCAGCHGHLGHVFYGEKYRTPTDARYCINSVCLRFIPDGTAEEQ